MDTESIVAGIRARVMARLKALKMRPSRASVMAGLGIDKIRDLTRKPQSLPRLDTLHALAPVLKTTPAWLAFGEGDMVADAERPPLVAVPVASPVAASHFVEVEQCSAHDDLPLRYFADLPPGGRYMALKVRGDSMDLVAPDGSLAVVRLDDRKLRKGAFYVFADGGAATFKRYMTAPERLEPYSTNRAHEAIFPAGEIRVIGRVIRIVLDL